MEDDSDSNKFKIKKTIIRRQQMFESRTTSFDR